MLVTDDELKGAPATFAAKSATGFSGLNFHLAISALDCTGCGNCVDVCPAKEKALVMKPLADQRPMCEDNWRFGGTIAAKPVPAAWKLTVKGSQFAQPLQEFSGACAGCGETPYAKLITQLFGERMMVSNAAGCSTVWGRHCPLYFLRHKRAGARPGMGIFPVRRQCGIWLWHAPGGYTASPKRLNSFSPKRKRTPKIAGKLISGWQPTDGAAGCRGFDFGPHISRY